MPRNYLISRKVSMTDRFSITDETGAPQYTTAAVVAQQRGLRERFAVEVADQESPVLMLALILVIETIRDRRRAAASS